METSGRNGREPPREEGRAGVWFHTFGCKANQYDTQRIRQELESRGARSVEEPGNAEVAVVNTCTVTNQADADARHLVRRLRREHPRLRILVAGCSAARRESGYAEMAEVDHVVPGQDPAQVAGVLDPFVGSPSPSGVESAEGEGAPPADGSPSGEVDRAHPPGLVGRRILERDRRRTRGWLKIQDGCDRKCSFCATRLARGASRSRPAARIVREARHLARGHPEIVLTGIHIGHYGRELPGGESLWRLCARLLDEVPDVRFRLTSIEATEIPDELVGLMAGSGGRLAPHLHVPLQSGSDTVLRLMRRWHTREAYRGRVLEIAARLPLLGLGADVIVGFPGEGDEEFRETRDLIEELPYTYLHVFPYSVRDGTAAAQLPDRVPGDVAADRSRELRRMAHRKGREHRVRRAGQVADVVLEGDEAVTAGMTGDYLRIEVRGEGLRPGTRVRAPLRGGPEGLHIRAAEARGV